MSLRARLLLAFARFATPEGSFATIVQVIDWCLRLDPLERPQSIFALQKAIREIAPKKRKMTFLGALKNRLFSDIGA